MKEYYLSLTFGGDVWKIQDEVEEILGDSSGSGFCLMTGKRDLSYDFNNLSSLKAAVRKVRRMPRRIKCEAWDMEGDWEKVSLRGIK